MIYPEKVLTNLRSHLRGEKLRVEKRLASLRLQDPYADPDRLMDNAASDTEAKEESSHERMEALENELNLNLAEISQALSRIDKGTYGKCLICGIFIDTDRLAVKPTALYCVVCAQKVQQKKIKI